MEIQRIKLGFFAVNCYLIKEAGHVLIIDPGARANKILEALQEQEHVEAIVLTHGHFDHIGAVDALVNQFHCPVYLNPKDEELARDMHLNALGKFSAALHCKTMPLEEPIVQIGSFQLKVFEAPGHTAGSCLIQIGNVMFTGDVLFKGSIGRCDLYSGNESEMRRSLKQFQKMDPELILYPGHEEPTMLQDELNHNPFLKERS